MKLLLDTHVVLWWLDDQNLIAEDTVEAISAPENQVLVSAVVAWEIAIKRTLGKLTAPHNLEAVIASAGFDQLPVTPGSNGLPRLPFVGGAGSPGRLPARAHTDLHPAPRYKEFATWCAINEGSGI